MFGAGGMVVAVGEAEVLNWLQRDETTMMEEPAGWRESGADVGKAAMSQKCCLVEVDECAASMGRNDQQLELAGTRS